MAESTSSYCCPIYCALNKPEAFFWDKCPASGSEESGPHPKRVLYLFHHCVLVIIFAMMHKSTFLMKPKPASEHSCPEIVHIMWAIKPCIVKIWNSGELTAAHICGLAPLP